jgi:hypothetical protein
MSNPSRVIDALQIEISIMMLKQYVGEDDIAFDYPLSAKFR